MSHIIMPRTDSMDRVYRSLSIQLFTAGKPVNGTTELNNVHFTLTDINNNVPLLREPSKAYMIAELVWYILGRKDIDFISTFAGLWGRISDDGENAYSAYGEILKYRHGFDQVEKIIELLKKDPYSRRAVLNLNVPNENVIETKDEICTIALQFFIRDGNLHCTTMMRSNDIWFGLPYDVIFFTELQKYIAGRLGVEYGEYHHFVTSLHVYDRNYNQLKAIEDKEMPKERLHIDFHRLMCAAPLIADLVDSRHWENPKNEIVDFSFMYKILEFREV